MKLITLGTSHGDPGQKRFCSALLLSTSQGDYLFEAGAPVNALFIRKNIPFERLKAVFISHSHEDHTGGLPGLLKSIVKRPVPGQFTRVFLPEKSCIDGVASFMASTHRPCPPELVSFEEVRAGAFFDDGNLKVTAFQTDHMSNENMHYPCWAFLVEAEGKRVVFTGDLSRDLHDFPLQAFEKSAVCVMECQHYPAVLAGKLLKQLPIERFIGVHISERWNGCAEKFYRALGSPAYSCELAEDGMEFDLSNPPVSPGKIAVLADLHLPDSDNTAKEKVLNWAVEQIRKQHVSHIVCAGDMTAKGTYPAARRLVKKLKTLSCKFFHTPGNAERRTVDPQAQKVLTTSSCDDRVLMLDSSTGILSSDSRVLLLRLLAEGNKKNLLAVTHYPPQNFPEEDLLLLAAAHLNGIISQIVYGHEHYDKNHRMAGIPCAAVRGLDPDKAIGGPPSVVFFELDHDNVWRRENVSFPSADFRRWSREQKQEFLNHLGLSTMSDPFGILQFAIEEKVPVLEWRYTALDEEKFKLFQELLSRWRQNGGKSFSIHFPDIKWENNRWTGQEALKEAVKTAQLFNACRITFHVPRISIGAYAANEKNVLDILSEIFSPLAEAGIAIGIENLHMNPGEKDDTERGFGYTPQEVISFADKLIERGIPAGLHLDIGHARNNAPFSKTYNVSDYLALFNSRVNGCHLHQVTIDETGKMLNHQALTEPFGKLISLGSLFMAWQDGTLPHVPLILEIRGGRGPESLRKLRNFFLKNGSKI